MKKRIYVLWISTVALLISVFAFTPDEASADEAFFDDEQMMTCGKYVCSANCNSSGGGGFVIGPDGVSLVWDASAGGAVYTWKTGAQRICVPGWGLCFSDGNCNLTGGSNGGGCEDGCGNEVVETEDDAGE